MTPLFESAHARCWLDEAVPCLALEWLGYVPSHDYRRTLEQVLLAFVHTHEQVLPPRPLVAALTDATLFGAQLTTDQEWAVQSFGLRWLRAGGRYWAVVRPRHPLGRQAFANRLAHIAAAGHDDTVTIRIFDDRAAARAWLREVVAGTSVPT